MYAHVRFLMPNHLTRRSSFLELLEPYTPWGDEQSGSCGGGAETMV